MPQIVATIEKDPMYMLKMALQSVQASILEDLSFKQNIETTYDYHDCFQYVVADCKTRHDLDSLLDALQVKGVWNLHVWSEDDFDLTFSKEKHGNRFHYCNGVFKA